MTYASWTVHKLIERFIRKSLDRDRYKDRYIYGWTERFVDCRFIGKLIERKTYRKSER